ncbi:recombinase family protein [Hungatella hathewayi]|uniref:recombinase family protein n=1 Tax=Hungatella hathewayi TaxID=154046 RepID=UPI0035623D41
MKLAEHLTSEGILTLTGKTGWHAIVIHKMLSNEKYMGDALLQKIYTVDFLVKKRVLNKGIVPQYYIEGNHQAIVPRELFYKVQEEKAHRANVYRPAKKKGTTIRGKYSCQYVLSDIMICRECGQPYRRQVWVNNGIKKPVWRCYSRLNSGTKKCKHSPSLEEKTHHSAIMEAVNSVVEEKGEFVDAFRENVIRIRGGYSENVEPTEYDEEIDSRQKQMLALIGDSAKAEYADEEFDWVYREFANQLKDLKKKQAKLLREKQLAEAYEQRVEDVDTYVKKVSYLKRQFDDELVRRLIKTIKVISSDKIEIQHRELIITTKPAAEPKRSRLPGTQDC